MELLKLTIAIVFYSITASASVEDDGFLYLDSTNVSYKFIQNSEDFYFHELNCQSYGASIWIPKSAQEITNILTIFEREYFEYIWLGIFQKPFYGVSELLGLNGRTDFFTDWDDENDTHHHSLGAKISRNGKYTLVSLNEKYPTICVRDEENLFTSKTLDLYTNIEKYNALYKFYHFATYLPQAHLKCFLDGAALWVPESSQEIEVIFNYLIPKKLNSILIGIHNYFRSGFISIDGRRNYYSNWIEEYPRSTDLGAIIFRNGSYGTSANGRFVCKRKTKQIEDVTTELNTEPSSVNTEHSGLHSTSEQTHSRVEAEQISTEVNTEQTDVEVTKTDSEESTKQTDKDINITDSQVDKGNLFDILYNKTISLF